MNISKPPAAPASPESFFAAGALALAYLLPQSTAEAWALKWPLFGCLLLVGAAGLASRTGAVRRYGAAWAWAPAAAWVALCPFWSLNPQRSLIEAVFLSCGLMVVFLGRGRINPAVSGVCIMGLGAAELAAQGWQMATGTAEGPTRLFGSFVNANHHAALLLAAYGIAAARAACKGPGAGSAFLAAAVIFLAGAELSQSRAIFLAVPAILALLWALKPTGFERRSFGLLAALSFVLLLSPAGPARRVAEEFAGQDSFAMKRSEIWTAAFMAIRARPLAGVGLGSFGDVFPSVRSGALSIFATDYAHNEPLQFAAETGVVGLGLAAWAAAAAAALVRTSLMAGPVAFGPVLAAAAVAVLALTDFTFHVPLLGGIFAVGLASGLRGRRTGGRPAPLPVRAALYGVAATVGIWLAACGASEYNFARGARAAAAGDIPGALQFLERSLLLWPNNAEALNALDGIAPDSDGTRLRAAMRLRPGWAVPLEGIFGRALGQNKLPEAGKALSIARRLDPHGLGTRLMAARMDAATGRFRSAREQLDALEAIWPGHVDLVLARAELEFKIGNAAVARRIIERVLSLYPMNLAARKMLDNPP